MCPKGILEIHTGVYLVPGHDPSSGGGCVKARPGAEKEQERSPECFLLIFCLPATMAATQSAQLLGSPGAVTVCTGQ